MAVLGAKRDIGRLLDGSVSRDEGREGWDDEDATCGIDIFASLAKFQYVFRCAGVVEIHLQTDADEASRKGFAGFDSHRGGF